MLNNVILLCQNNLLQVCVQKRRWKLRRRPRARGLVQAKPKDSFFEQGLFPQGHQGKNNLLIYNIHTCWKSTK